MREYYAEMIKKERAIVDYKHGKIVGVVTFFIGDDDVKYMLDHEPWTVVEDNPNGSTLYVDQLIIAPDYREAVGLRQRFKLFVRQVKERFPNIKSVKWVRAPASFRKNYIEGEPANVHHTCIK